MSLAPCALVADDVSEWVVLGRRLLQKEGYAVVVAGDGPTALELARTAQPELLLLDVELPGMDGVEVCRRLREFSDSYVIMVSAHDSEVDRILGLGAGADDYVGKPFSVPELALRVRAMRRRPRVRQDALRVYGDLQIDPLAREAWRGGEALELTRTEFDLLATLSASPRRPFTRAALLQAVWGSTYVDQHLVDVHLGNLRRKLGESVDRPRHLRTLRGLGYRFDP